MPTNFSKAAIPFIALSCTIFAYAAWAVAQSAGGDSHKDPKIGGQTPTFGVSDIERARKILEDRGAKFDGDTIEIPDMVKLATFYDPDGNPLMRFQSLSDMAP